MRDVSDFQHFVILPEGLTCKRLTVGDDGQVYAYCDDAAGGEASVQISSGDDHRGHINQVFRIGTNDG